MSLRAQLLKKLHTEKSVIIQQYQVIFPGNYSILINPNKPENVAQVEYDNGKCLSLSGQEFGCNFLKMERNDLYNAVKNILKSLEAAQQEKLWTSIGLDAYPRIYPVEGSALPYFVLDRNEDCRFAYCPIAEEKYAILVHNDFGKLFMDLNHKAFGSYDNSLNSILSPEDSLNCVKIATILADYEPSDVWQYSEPSVLNKLDQMAKESHARPFIFDQAEGIEPIIEMPEEAKDYLTPAETGLAEKLILLQVSAETEPAEPEAAEFIDQTPEELPIEDEGMEMSM